MTKGAIKAIAIGLSALFIGATVAAGVGSAVGGKPFQNPHIETWFNNWGKPTAATPSTESWGGVIDNVGNEMTAETTYAMPAAMAFYATASDDVAQNMRLSAPSVTVTCSHNFEFNNVLVDWSIEYPSGASATDVVTVTPTGDGSLTANVSCSAPFDTQLTLKATLRGNSEKTATCTIDYVKRIDRFNNIFINGSDFGDGGGIGCNPVFGTGTVNGNLNIKRACYFLDSDFESEVQSYLKFDIAFQYYVATDLALDSNYSCNDEDWSYSMFIKDFNNYDEAHKNAIYYAWHTAFTNGKYSTLGKANIILNVDIRLLYNGNVIQTISETDYVYHYNQITGEYYADGIAPDLTLNTNVAL